MARLQPRSDGMGCRWQPKVRTSDALLRVVAPEEGSGNGNHHQPVLIVEDDPDISELLVALFESVGFQAVAARDGRIALDLVWQVKPAAITLDLSLPDIDGCEVLHNLKSEPKTRAIPVIVVSAVPSRLCEDDYSLVTAVVVKPFDADELVNIVRSTTPIAARHLSR